MLDGLTKWYGIEQVVDVGWTNKVIWYRTGGRCWMD